MIDKVRSFIKEYGMFEKGDRVVAGVSGGADSVALLEVLYELKEELDLCLFVVHINHGIREEAGEDACYVSDLCEKMKLPFFLFEENIPKLAEKEKCTDEEMGRIYRYRCFNNVMDEVCADKLAVAHHMDDQAETILFHMIRGTDLAGLGGMRPVSGKVVRPLLCLRKSEITKWLTDRGIDWREDATNSDENYTRNRIRINVIPELQKVNDKAVPHMTYLAARINEYDEYIKKQAYSFIEEFAEDTGNGIRINRQHLLKQDKILAQRVLYELLTSVCKAKKDITGEHILSLYELIDKLSGKKLSLPYKVTAFNSYEWLHIEREDLPDNGDDRAWKVDIDINGLSLEGQYKVDLPDGGTLVFSVMQMDLSVIGDNSENLQKNYTKYFDCDTIGDTLQIRYPKKEDYLVVDEKGHRKKIGKFYKDVKIPASLRGSLPVLSDASEILWLLGIRRTEAHRITQATKRILAVEYSQNNIEQQD